MIADTPPCPYCFSRKLSKNHLSGLPLHLESWHCQECGCDPLWDCNCIMWAMDRRRTA